MAPVTRKKKLQVVRSPSRTPPPTVRASTPGTPASRRGLGSFFSPSGGRLSASRGRSASATKRRRIAQTRKRVSAVAIARALGQEQKAKKPRRFEPGPSELWRILKFATSAELDIPFHPFVSFVKEVTDVYSKGNVTRWTAQAILMLQENLKELFVLENVLNSGVKCIRQEMEESLRVEKENYASNQEMPQHNVAEPMGTAAAVTKRQRTKRTRRPFASTSWQVEKENSANNQELPQHNALELTGIAAIVKKRQRRGVETQAKGMDDDERTKRTRRACASRSCRVEKENSANNRELPQHNVLELTGIAAAVKKRQRRGVETQAKGMDDDKRTKGTRRPCASRSCRVEKENSADKQELPQHNVLKPTGIAATVKTKQRRGVETQAKGMDDDERLKRTRRSCASRSWQVEKENSADNQELPQHNVLEPTGIAATVKKRQRRGVETQAKGMDDDERTKRTRRPFARYPDNDWAA